MLLAGIALFLVSLPIVYYTRRSVAGRWKWAATSLRRRCIETVAVAWFFWTLCSTLIPIHRLEAWVDAGGYPVTGIATLLMIACLKLRST